MQTILATAAFGSPATIRCENCGYKSQLDPCQRCLYAAKNPHVRLPGAVR
jgi:hypothetical protein